MAADVEIDERDEEEEEDEEDGEDEDEEEEDDEEEDEDVDDDDDAGGGKVEETNASPFTFITCAHPGITCFTHSRDVKCGHA